VIAVVIVNWNGRSLLDACLESVSRQTLSPAHVILVDNGSTDGSQAHVAAVWPRVRLVALDRNLGVAAGNNVGVEVALAAGATSVVFLNSDAEPAQDALALLASELERSGRDVWAAAPKILYRRNPSRIWSAGGEFDWWRGLSRDRGTDQLDRGQYDVPGDIDYANTCCLMVRAEAFQRVGRMDEAYYMYFDDSDFSARLRRRGGRIRYVPAARVLHDVQSSSQGAPSRPSLFALYYTTRNRVRFIQRNAPTPVHRLAAHLFTVASRLVRAAQAGLTGEVVEARLVLGALCDGYIRRQTGPLVRTLPTRAAKPQGAA
jgi:GT2 family glycosyltransferase